jgi:hypothetical protein
MPANAETIFTNHESQITNHALVTPAASQRGLDLPEAIIHFRHLPLEVIQPIDNELIVANAAAGA